MLFNAVSVVPLVAKGRLNEENDFILTNYEAVGELKRVFNVNLSQDLRNFDINEFQHFNIKSIGLLGNVENLIKFLKEKLLVSDSIVNDIRNEIEQVNREGLFLIILKDGNDVPCLFLQFLLFKNYEEMIETNTKQLLVFLRILTRFNGSIFIILNQNEVDLMQLKTKQIPRIKIIENKDSLNEVKIERKKNIDLIFTRKIDKLTFLQSKSDKICLDCTKFYDFYKQFEVNCDDLKKFIESMNNSVGLKVKLNYNDTDYHKFSDNIPSNEGINENEINEERYKRHIYLLLYAFSKLFVVEYQFLLKLHQHLDKFDAENLEKIRLIFMDYLRVEKFIQLENIDITKIEQLVRTYVDENKVFELHRQAMQQLILDMYDTEEANKHIHSLENVNGKDRYSFILESKRFWKIKLKPNEDDKSRVINQLNGKVTSMSLDESNARVIFDDFFQRITKMIEILNTTGKYIEGFIYTKQDVIKANLRERQVLENYIKGIIPSRGDNDCNNIVIQGIIKQENSENFILLCAFHKALIKHDVHAFELGQIYDKSFLYLDNRTLFTNFDTLLSEKSDCFHVDDMYLLHLVNRYDVVSNAVSEKRLSVSLLARKGADFKDKFYTCGRPYLQCEFYHQSKLLAILFNNQNRLSISTYKIITNRNDPNLLEQDQTCNLTSLFKSDKTDEEFINSIQIKFEHSHPILWVRIKEILYSIDFNTNMKKQIDLSESNPNTHLNFVFDSSQFITQDDFYIYSVVKSNESDTKISTINKPDSGFYHITTVAGENNEAFLYFINFKEKACQLSLLTSVKMKNDKTSQYMITNKEGEQKVKETILGSIISSFKTYAIQSAIEMDGSYVKFNNLHIIKMSETVMEKDQINKYFKQKLNELQNTNKTNDCMILSDARLTFSLYKEFDNSIFKATIEKTKEYKLNEWCIMYLTMLPLKILKLENNEVKLIQHNETFNIDKDNKINSTQLSSEINFDFLENIISKWNKEVRVITTMGKQSTGKSYFLNHLFGTLFTSSAKRCTTGCWMSVKITEQCLYVVLDFEAFGTLERTCQEDAILSLINYAIGNICFFKTERAGIDREIESLIIDSHEQFIKMKWWSSKDVFHGKLIFIINDVNEDDEESAIESFAGKIQNIRSKITGSLVSQIEIWPSPLFHTDRYQNGLIQFIKDFFETDDDMTTNKYTLNKSYKNGSVFNENFKLLVASMVIQDFTPFDRQKYEKALKYIQDNFESALYNGKTSDGSKLFIKFTHEEIEDKISLIIDSNASVEVNDVDNDFSSEFYTNIQKHFMSQLGHKDNLCMQQLHETFNNNFLLPLIDFRKNKCDKWLNENLNFDFEECKIELNNFKDKLNIWSERTQLLFKLCASKCDSCHGLCILKKTHTENHNCGTDHSCNEKCSYGCKKSCFKSMFHEKADTNDGLHKCENRHPCDKPCKYSTNSNCLENCKFERDHDDDHICNKLEHFCNNKCKFSSDSSYQCEEHCWFHPGHKGVHQCNKYHVCNHKCSLPGCNKKCDVRDKLNHEIHKCSTKNGNICLEKCRMPGCKNYCCFPDHFHCSTLFDDYNKENNIKFRLDEHGINSYKNKYTRHICDKEHDCYKVCNKTGYCKQEMFITRDSVGLDNVQLNLKRASEGIKEKCSIKIPKFTEIHESNNHSCNALEHYCTIKCPACNSLCYHPVGHEGLHDTSHTNMSNCNKVGDNLPIDINTASLMCNIYCTERGRGHLHIVQTNREEDINEIRKLNGKNCKDLDQIELDFNRLVINTDLSDPSFYALNHGDYWNYIKFKDPCSNANLSKCNYRCPSNHHHPSFCILEKFHKSELNNVNAMYDKCYISRDGHVFQCNEPKFHFYFCVDDSGSMLTHDRRKVAISTIKDFLNRRKINRFNDLVTFINFGSYTKIELEKNSINDCLDFISNSKNQLAGCRSSITFSAYSTKLVECIDTVKQLLNKNSKEEKENSHTIVVITDGGIHDKSNEFKKMKADIQEICKTGSLYLMFIEDKKNLQKFENTLKENNEWIITNKEFQFVKLSKLGELTDQFQLLSKENENKDNSHLVVKINRRIEYTSV